MAVITPRHHRVRRLFAAAPRAWYVLLCIAFSETTNAAVAALPTDLDYLLPWLVRLLTAIGGTCGLFLIHSACWQTKGRLIADLHQLDATGAMHPEAAPGD
jgi:hypothetical protein